MARVAILQRHLPCPGGVLSLRQGGRLTCSTDASGSWHSLAARCRDIGCQSVFTSDSCTRQRRNALCLATRDECAERSSSALGEVAREAIASGLWPGTHEEYVSVWLRRSSILLGCAPREAFDMARKFPSLLSLSANEIASRILCLKSILPHANIPALLKLRPSLLLMDDMEGDVRHAIRQMQALMPGTAVEAKLHLAGTQYWTFVELLSR